MDDHEYHVKFGRVATCMARSEEYCQYPIACLTLWIRPAILLEQIHFFVDEYGVTKGYMTWAFLAEDTEERLLNDPEVLFHVSEWNEGDRMWIMDLVLDRMSIKSAIQEATSILPNIRFARSLRRGDDGAVRKVTTWRRDARLFRRLSIVASER